MSEESEAAGAFVTAGLVAKAVEGHGVPHGDAHPPQACLNCNAPMTGAYCAACGQPAHIHRSLLHLMEELLHGLLHFETKAWRTLPLLMWKPGVLTRRYIDGQRVRYVSPLAIFLFSVFLMFLAFSFTAAPQGQFGPGSAKAADRQGLVTDVTSADREVARAQAALDLARARKEDVAGAESELNQSRVERSAAAAALTAFDLAASKAAAAASAPLDAASASASSPAVDEDGIDPRWFGDLRRTKIDTGSARLDKAIRHAIANPALALYKLKSGASKYSFMLVPISLPFLWAMFFWRRGITMYDHAVFALYSLSFMALLFVVVALLSALHAEAVSSALVLFVPPVHMFRQLRDTYRLSTFSTLWRTVVLAGVCAIVVAVFALFLVAVTIG